ncbi:hypothetical protein [Aeromonas salmonicida]|uniref:hypothetical protein n=1 Tax=Aeromonas salmonicida TaxID=645 RepID=UPI0038B81FBB
MYHKLSVAFQGSLFGPILAPNMTLWLFMAPRWPQKSGGFAVGMLHNPSSELAANPLQQSQLQHYYYDSMLHRKQAPSNTASDSIDTTMTSEVTAATDPNRSPLNFMKVLVLQWLSFGETTTTALRGKCHSLPRLAA